MTATMEGKTRTEHRPPEDRRDGALSVFTTVSLILLLYGFCWLKNNLSFTPPQIINVMFSEIAGLNQNACVFVDGVRVGIVDKIDWQESHKVLVKVRINSDKVHIPVGSKVSILTNGIVGAKYIEFVLPPNASSAPAIPSDMIVQGEDPVRPELAVNNLAVALGDIDMQHLRQVLQDDHDRLIATTNKVNTLMDKTVPLVEKTIPLEEKAIVLADDMTRISKRLSKLLNNPNLSGDLKETAHQMRITMQHVQSVMQNLNLTLSDENLRKDIIETMDKLNRTTTSVEKSMEIVQSMGNDKELRGDVKQILQDARSATSKLDKIVSDPTFGTDLKGTLVKSQDAIEHIDLAARQLNQMLDKRAPLVHMMFGRPGKLPKDKRSPKKIIESLKPAPQAPTEAPVPAPAATLTPANPEIINPE